MTVVREDELEFEFPEAWKTEVFDLRGRSWPKGISPVDFIVERPADILLIEVKDPSASRAPQSERERFVKKMQTDELTHMELVPKARSSWSYLHLMDRAKKPLRFVVVIGAEALSLQPLLLQSLADRLKKRLAHEADAPWTQPYVVSCVVVAAADLGQFLDGVKVTRKAVRT